MKKKTLLKLKIIFTNLCRAVLSFSFVSLITACKGIDDFIQPTCYTPEPVTCYDMPAPIIDEIAESITPTPQANIGSASETTFNILLIIIPVAIVTLGIGYIIYRKYKRKKIADKIKEENNNAGD